MSRKKTINGRNQSKKREKMSIGSDVNMKDREGRRETRRKGVLGGAG